jgi:hypothetical protein
MPCDALIEPILITAPPPLATIAGASAPVRKYADFTLTVQIWSKAASSVPAVGPIRIRPGFSPTWSAGRIGRAGS